MSTRQSKIQRKNNPVTPLDNVLTLKALAAARDLVAAQKANHKTGISSHGLQLLLDAPDHVLAGCFSSAEAFDEEHSMYIDDDGPAPPPSPAASGSSAAAPHTPRVRATPHTAAYMERVTSLESNWRSHRARQEPLLDDLHLFWQRESMHKRLQSLARIKRMIQAYLAKPIHTYLAADGKTVVRCDGHCTVRGHEEVWYRNLEHGLGISVPKLECTVCGSKFRMPPCAIMCFPNSPVAPSCLYDLTFMDVVDKFSLTGMTIAAVCTALNQCRHDTWLYGPDSYLFHSINSQQLDQAYRWYITMFRDLPSPEKHTGCPLATEFFPGPCGKCPVCSRNAPATKEECVLVASAGYTPEFESALVSNIASQHAVAAAFIAEDDRSSASPIAAAAGVTAVVHVTVVAAFVAAGEVAAEGAVAAADAASAAEEAVAATTSDVTAAVSVTDSQSAPPEDVVLDCCAEYPAQTLGQPVLNQNLPCHIQPQELQQQPVQSEQPQFQPASCHQQQQRKRPLQQQRITQPSAAPSPLTSSLLPRPVHSSGRALLGFQAHTGSPSRISSCTSTPGARWALGSQLQSQDHTSLPTPSPQLCPVPPLSNAIDALDETQAPLADPSASITDAAPAPRVRLRISTDFGCYSFLWPIVPRFFYLTADGAQKLTHYANAGKEHTAAVIAMNVPVPFGRFFSPRVDYMYKMCATMRDNQEAAAASASAAAAASLAPGLSAGSVVIDDDDPCQAELLAARSEPPRGKTANTDVKVVAGCVCPHVVPVRGSFISSPDAENFFLYKASLMSVLKGGNLKIDGFILDINCQFSGNLAKDMPKLSALIKHQLVGWLHANAGHKLSCQLRFCGLYRKGLGRCIGEQSEQLWAILKHFTASTRYMSLIHRSEFLDYLLEHISNQKNYSIAEQLRLTQGISKRRKLELQQAILDLIASPQGHLLEQNGTYSLERVARVLLDRPMLYVKTLMELDYSLTLKLAGGIHLAALSPAGSKDLLGPEHFAKLEKKLLTHEKHLKLSLEQRWKKDEPEFQEHLHRLSLAEIGIAQLAIESQVSMLATLQNHRKQEGTSCRKTDELVRRMNVCRTKIKALLAALTCWNGTAGLPEIVLTEMDVYKNVLPWQTSSANSSIEQLQFKLYRMECEVMRCDEELEMLPGDAVKVLLYYGNQIGLLQAWLVKEIPHPATTPASGKVQLMFAKLQQVQRLQAKALQVFQGCRLLKEESRSA